ncbi:TPA: phase 1 flagellin transcriptional repressor [Citrobacter freundii]|uniref:Phase 1 flagellin transcriptional repressor n=1 Tax=Citrobacter freundii TaxID=546 RepID=A0A9P3ZBD3_CITFR|nr:MULTISPECIES: phase 1 flagellin transcriptional repressor [Enterobacteriaceae]RNL69328.1 phase 1 flagellin transcriptional repressor [Citrobacter sp. MH181794]HBH7045174.1 phase 1 flagellin transcriptional repressor [Citrobacter freundii]MCS1418040.1 phase 1 flagellin transcriptional repressor [Citrobacter portucalensis]NEY53839.1 phase 1 flagellin transcriptional repressor [Escherichia coli]HBK6104917.1 phase 1 flagellin transcriptional repressor [Citrobacter freundii]
MNDISYGRDAEKWPRDYSMLARRIQFLRFNDYPVQLVSCNGQSMIGYISKFNQSENIILISNEAKGNNRVEVKLESLSSLEELSLNCNISAKLVDAVLFAIQPCEPTRKDFFSICNKCFKQGIGIKIHMLDGRILVGDTTGVNACHVGLKKKNGNHMQIMFDWVGRITSSDYIEK